MQSPGHTDRSCWWGSCKLVGGVESKQGRKRKRKRGDVWVSVGEASCQEQRARGVKAYGAGKGEGTRSYPALGHPGHWQLPPYSTWSSSGWQATL